jgi:nucleoside-diphosphate-sugar epimerase
MEASREVVHDQAFNVGRDEDVVQIRTIATQVAEHTGCPVTFAQGAGPDTRDYQVSFAKINALLPAWQPRWTVPQGIEELATHMRRYGLAAEDFEGPRYVRLARIRQLMADGLLDDELRMQSAGVAR